MAVEVFQRTTRAVAGGVRWYKRLDVEGLRKCIQRYGWNGTCLDVAAGILSSTVVAHPFPNANHRTAVSLCRLYLGSVGITWPHYDLRGRGVRRYVRDTAPFFLRSKTLLQLLRHRQLVRLAHEEGFTDLRLGLDKEVPIVEEDLRLEPLEIRRRHLRVSADLLERLSDEPARFGLYRPNKPGLRDWVRWYQRG